MITTRQDLYRHGVEQFGEQFAVFESREIVPYYEAIDRGTIISDAYGRGAIQ